LNAPDVRTILAKHYVIVKLNVMEEGAKKSLENPGGGKILADLGGEKSGLPFFAFLDRKGKKIADANVLPGGQNIGCPAKSEEIAAFEKLLRQTAPRMSDADRATVTDRLKKASPGR
jgi:hypothetical protein